MKSYLSSLYIDNYKFYSMLKFIRLLFCITALLFLFTACHKSSERDNSKNQNSYLKAVGFLKQRQSVVSSYQIKKLDILLQNLSDTTAKTIKIGETELVLVDLKNYKNVKNAKYANTFYKMSFPLNDGEIAAAFIYTIHTDLDKNTVDRDMQNILLMQSKGFSGEVVTNALNDRFIQAYVVKEGRLEKNYGLKRETPGLATQSTTNTTTEDCTAYYLLTTTYYSDGHIEQTTQYLFTLCGSCNTGGQPVDHFEADCDPDNNGGGGGDPNTYSTEQVEQQVEEADTYGRAPTIKYLHPATIVRANGEVIDVIMSPVTVFNPFETYIDEYSRNTTRTLTLFGQSYGWIPLGVTAYLHWTCQVHGKYVYGDGVSPIYTRQWTFNHSRVY